MFGTKFKNIENCCTKWSEAKVFQRLEKSHTSSVSGTEKSGEVPIGKAFQGIPVLPTDGCTAWAWVQWGAEVSLPSEVPGR